MSVADLRGARRRMKLRYKAAHRRTVQELIEEGRLKAARAASIKKKA